jgi:hypothetical protein
VQPGDRLADRYDILRPLGAGGMGEVFLARDTTLERDVAIKVLPEALSADPIARERFRREALAAAGLDHPFICKVFEIGDADNRLFIVMEYVAGETLHAVLGRGPLSSGDLLALALELTDALEAAHARQIVHRDLKPANIMLTSQHHAKVMDFGLAKLVPDASAETRVGSGAPITEQGTRVGTPAYMSPEQVAGDAVDHRSDIFSLGVLLIEAVTGVHPFLRDTMAGTMTAVLNDPPLVHAAASVGEMHPSLRAVLLRMLMKAPDARYQSVSEVRSDLRSIGLARTDAAAGGRSPAPADESASKRHRWAMVGRDTERAELVRHLDAALSGHGGVVLIGGEPGIGKTRLTEDLLAEARRRGASGLVDAAPRHWHVSGRRTRGDATICQGARVAVAPASGDTHGAAPPAGVGRGCAARGDERPSRASVICARGVPRDRGQSLLRRGGVPAPERRRAPVGQ